MGVLENQLFNEIDGLPASKSWFVQFAARNGVTTSDTRMAQAKSGKDYDGEMIVALLNQVSRLKKFRDAMSPLPIRFDDPDMVAGLVNDFDAGKLSITVNRFEEMQLIRQVYWIEFTDDRSLFRGIVSGEVQETTVPTEAAPIADEQTAHVARDILRDMGRACRVTDGRVRIAESKLVKNLAELGFTTEPAVAE
jgi:hypothetical protein